MMRREAELSGQDLDRLVHGVRDGRTRAFARPMRSMASRTARGPRPCRWRRLGADQLDAEALQHAVRARSSAQFSAVWPPMVGSSASGRSFSMIFRRSPLVIGSM